MLNLQVAETMELTEAELQEVVGGQIAPPLKFIGSGSMGISWSLGDYWKGYFNFGPKSPDSRRRY